MITLNWVESILYYLGALILFIAFYFVMQWHQDKIMKRRGIRFDGWVSRENGKSVLMEWRGGPFDWQRVTPDIPTGNVYDIRIYVEAWKK